MTRKRVFIADDDRTLVTALALRCQRMGLEVRKALDGTTALAMIRELAPDLIFLDVAMPGEDGLRLCEILAGDRITDRFIAPTPVIILTGKSDTATVQRCKDLGAHYFFKGPDLWPRLEQTVRDLLGLTPETSAAPHPPTAEQPAAAAPGSPSPKLTVLVIDDDPAIAKALKIRLEPHGVALLSAQTGTQGYWIALRQRPDAVILDIGMPEGHGQYVLGRLKSHPLTCDIPVIILTGHVISGRKDYGLERELLGLGATCMLTKPLQFDELLAQLRTRLPIPSTPRPALRPTLRSLQPVASP